MSWGKNSWGASAWGGGGGPIQFVNAIAIRDNVIRLEFTDTVYFTGLKQPEDGSQISKYTVTPVPGTIGYDGTEARAVSVAEVKVAQESDGVIAEDIGRFIDLYLDRWLTPYAAQYIVAVTDVFALDLGSSISGEIPFDSVFRKLARPSPDQNRLSKDLANPQNIAAARESLPNPEDPGVLGTYSADDSGDYAFDSGSTSFRKRAVRRFVTKKNGFAHLPGYGIGIPQYGKQLAANATITRIIADGEAQLRRGPDVERVKIKAIKDPTAPNLYRFQIIAVMRNGQAQRVEFPLLVK